MELGALGRGRRGCRGRVEAGLLPFGPVVSGTQVCLVALLRLGSERGTSGGSCRPVTFKHCRDKPD